MGSTEIALEGAGGSWCPKARSQDDRAPVAASARRSASPNAASAAMFRTEGLVDNAECVGVSLVEVGAWARGRPARLPLPRRCQDWAEPPVRRSAMLESSQRKRLRAESPTGRTRWQDERMKEGTGFGRRRGTPIRGRNASCRVRPHYELDKDWTATITPRSLCPGRGLDAESGQQRGMSGRVRAATR